ncbi:transcription repressor OFP12-like [Juglans microcarpa x Juglans regia]|uniref:transcription repressor OFP12-like n=1 Tax=Juglans microcarpa x Juglans regia TaxID=2249226 RepID=UPI001B7F00E7|nr:transcription repressor OFP12-like [Juglans microcarpa x Juglans regia]
MPISTLGRNINLCFMKIKWPPSPQSPSSQTPDHDHHHDHTLIPTTTSTSTLMIRNFNSLYDHTSDSSSPLSATASSSSYVEPDPDDDTTATAADFASAFASHRFFFSSPGRSNSIVESTIDESNLPPIIAAAQKPEKVFNNGVPVPKYSPDPYADFRRSMQEMVEARELVDVKSNWEFLHELLLCYLALNPKNTHKFIVGAFADLLVSLMSQQPSEGYRRTDPNLARCYEEV